MSALQLVREERYIEVSPWRLRIREMFFPQAILHTASRGIFERFMLVILVLNMVIAAMYNPDDRNSTTTKSQVLLLIDMVITVIYLLELILHGLAFGFSRFLNVFRLIDFALVIGNGVIVVRHYAADGQYVSLNTLRTLRIIRPFFTTYTFRQIRVLVVSVTRSIYELGDVILLYLLFLAWFGVAAVYQFGGVMRNRCVLDVYTHLSRNPSTAFAVKDGPSIVSFQEVNYTLQDFVCGRGQFIENYYRDPNPDNVAALTPFNLTVISNTGCTGQQTCDLDKGGLTGYICPFGFTCMPVENPYNGFVSLDNILEALLVIYTCVTFQLWYEVMFWTRDATDFLAYFFFLAVVLIGAYLIINLTVVIITVEFEKGKEKERKRLKELTEASHGRGFAGVVQRLIISEKTKNLNTQQMHRPDGHPPQSTTTTCGVPAQIAALNSLEQQLMAIESMEVEDGWIKLEDGTSVLLESDDPEMRRRRRMRLPLWERAQMFLHDKVVTTKCFQYFTILVILANLVCLCYVHYGMTLQSQEVLEKLNLSFTIFFAVEALLTLTAFGPFAYIKDFHNCFDVVIVVVSLIEVLVPAFNFPIVRGFRALRCIKLLKQYPSLYNWIIFIVKATRTSPLLLLLLSLIVFIFGCMAMQLLGGRFCGLDPTEPAVDGVCAGLPRANFDTFGQSLITAFQIVTADDWNFIMYNAMATKGRFAALPFVAYFYMGNYVLLSLLIAVLLSANSEEREAAEEEKLNKIKENDTDGEPSKAGGDDPNTSQLKVDVPEGEEEFDPTADHAVVREIKGADRIDDFVAQLTNRNSCLVCIDNNRINFQKFIEHQGTEIFVAIIIIVGSVAMGMESPFMPPDTPFSRALWVTDIVMTVLYVVETLISCYAYGFISGYTSYLRRDWWNVMDFFLVIVSVVGVLLPESKGSNIIRYGKVLRSLRPLRLVRHSPGMKIVLSSLIGSLYQLKNVVIITVVFFGMWGIVGVYLFSGKLRKCRIGDIWYPNLPHANCTNLTGGVFDNDGPHFDHLLAAYTSLFQVATLEGWASIMYRVMDTVGVDEPPKRNASPAMSLYVIFIALFAGLFLMNLFVSVLIDAYNSTKRGASLQRSLRLARDQDGWMLSNKRLLRQLPLHLQKKYTEFEGDQELMSPTTNDESHVKYVNLDDLTTSFAGNSGKSAVEDVQDNYLRMKVRTIIRSPRFLNSVMFIIFLNFVAMATEHYPSSPSINQLQFSLNIAFTSLFALEAVMKIYAESFKMYLASRWNKLDFFVALSSVVGLLFEAFLTNRSSALIRGVRTIRLARLARGRLQIDLLISKFVHSLASLVYVGAVVLLVFFVFAIVGLKGFGGIKLGPFGDTTGLDIHNNFDSLDHAMLILTRIMTGGNWADIMRDCAVKPPFCDPNIGECGAISPLPQIYFILFLVISMFILRNLVTAVLLDSFASSALNRALTKEDAASLYKCWKKYDFSQQLVISPFHVLPFIRSLPPTSLLGFNKFGSRKRITMELRFLSNLKLFSVFSPLPFEDVVDVLCQMEYDVPAPGGRPFVVKERTEEDLHKYVSATSRPNTSPTSPKENRPLDPRSEDPVETICDEETDTIEERSRRCAALIMINAVVAKRRADKKRRSRTFLKKRRATVAALLHSPSETERPSVPSVDGRDKLDKILSNPESPPRPAAPVVTTSELSPTVGASQQQEKRRRRKSTIVQKPDIASTRGVSFDDLSSDDDDVDYEVMNKAIDDFDI